MKNSPRRPYNPGGASRNGRPFTHNHNKDQFFDSSGPSGKIRGTPQQVMEKYMNLGRDTLSSGDYVTAESYFQYAEHYRRLITLKKEERGDKEASHHQALKTPQEPSDTHQTLEVETEKSLENTPCASKSVPEESKPKTPSPVKRPQNYQQRSEAVDDNHLPAFLSPSRGLTSEKREKELTHKPEDETEVSVKKPRRRVSPKKTDA